MGPQARQRAPLKTDDGPGRLPRLGFLGARAGWHGLSPRRHHCARRGPGRAVLAAQGSFEAAPGSRGPGQRSSLAGVLGHGPRPHPRGRA